MKTLREHEAVDYLNRAAETISPDLRKFSRLNFLYILLRIQSSYFSRLITTDRNQLAAVQITNSGFPELPSWLNDVNAAFKELALVKMVRAKSLVPAIKRISDMDMRGFLDLSKRMSERFESDRILSSELDSLTNARQDYFSKLHTKYPNKSPIIYHNKNQNLLVLKKTGLTFGDPSKIYHHPVEIGLKYIDLPDSNFSYSFTILTTRIHDGPTGTIQILNKHTTLRQIGRVYNLDEFGILESPHFLDKFYKDPNFKYDRVLNGFPPPFFREIVSIDFPNLSVEERYIALREILNLKVALGKLEELSNLVLKGAWLDTKDYDSTNEQIAETIINAVQNLPNDEIKASMQIAFKESVQELLQRTQQLADTAYSTNPHQVLGRTPWNLFRKNPGELTQP